MDAVRNCLSIAVTLVEQRHKPLHRALQSALAALPATSGDVAWRKLLYTQRDDAVSSWQQVQQALASSEQQARFGARGVHFSYEPPSLFLAMHLLLVVLKHPTEGRPWGAPGPGAVCAHALHLLKRGIHSLAPYLGPDPSDKVHRAKLAFDVAQLEYLLALPPHSAYPSNYSGPRAPPQPQRALLQSALHQLRGAQASRGVLGMPPVYNKLLHFRALAASSPLLREHPLHPGLDVERLSAEYAKKGLVVIDGVLRPEVAAELRHFCLESTIWHDLKEQYLGAYGDAGFTHPLVLHVASALQSTFPFMGRHFLNLAWAYTYFNDSPGDLNEGIGTHSDEAAVNYNMWLTPDHANLSPGSGGLVVWPKKPPADWSYQEYNSNAPQYSQERARFLEGSEPVTVPYKWNRAVVFDSDFFHRSGDSHFRPGHASRRINLTYLFGNMRRWKL